MRWAAISLEPFNSFRTARRTKSKYAIFTFAMGARSCRVTITDRQGIAHTAEVTNSSLFEAVASALHAFRGNEWITEVPEGLTPVKVRVTDIPVDHEVKMKNHELARSARE
jgi:hypothetical protein